MKLGICASLSPVSWSRYDNKHILGRDPRNAPTCSLALSGSLAAGALESCSKVAAGRASSDQAADEWLADLERHQALIAAECSDLLKKLE